MSQPDSTSKHPHDLYSEHHVPKPEDSVSGEKVYTFDDPIPMAMWGKNHWSILAYIESVMIECAGFEVGFDARMTQNRHNFRVLAMDAPKPKRPGSYISPERSQVMKLEYSTKLNNGQQVTGHDDWCCIQDMGSAGLISVEGNDDAPSLFLPGHIMHLTPEGQKICAALRVHKQAGGMFGNFRATA
jgi:hypothetical protein